MKHTIEDLWNGNIAPGPNCGVKDAEIERISILMNRNKEALEKVSNREQKTMFKQYTNCMEEYIRLITLHAFCDGFCLGGKLLAEALSGDE